MILALLVAVLAVALGALLTAASGARPLVLGPLRTFAAAAAAAVVVTHLLPESLEELGMRGVLAFAIGLFAPTLLHRAPLLGRSRLAKLSPARLSLEAGFIGLVVHHVGDGLGIGAYAGLPGGIAARLDVLVALVAHTVPLVAVVTLAFRNEYGMATALRRSAALAAASAVGVLASFAVPESALASASPWIAAVVSGVLLHVVTHDWLEDLPKSETAKAADLAAAALGLSLALLGGSEPGHALERANLFASARRIAIASAPWLLGSLALSYGIERLFGARERHVERQGDSENELAGVGAALATSVLSPVSRAVRTVYGEARFSAQLTRQLGFAIGFEGVLLGLATYGVVWVGAALVASLVLPIVSGTVAMLANALAAPPASESVAAAASSLEGDDTEPAPGHAHPHALGTDSHSFRHFDRVTALWAVAVVGYAVLETSLSEGALLVTLGQPLELWLALATGLLVPSAGPVVLLLAALSSKGLSPGAALLVVLLSSSLGLSTLGQLLRRFGARRVLPALSWFICFTGALAVAVNRAAPIAAPIRLPDPWGEALAVALLLLIALRAQRAGLRRWLAGWPVARQGHHHHAHEHAGAHEHPHVVQP